MLNYIIHIYLTFTLRGSDKCISREIYKYIIFQHGLVSLLVTLTPCQLLELVESIYASGSEHLSYCHARFFPNMSNLIN